MLTRRGFAAVASCAICGIAEFIATEASAQGASQGASQGAPPPAATPGLTRKLLSQTDGPTPGYVTIVMEVGIEPGVTIGRHTHPGIESSYVLEGELELPVQGQPTRTVKAGDAFQIAPEVPHAGGKPSAVKAKLIVNYIVEKGKPLASPA
jgi:quercetin dioxygenase-like cupin family protein